LFYGRQEKLMGEIMLYFASGDSGFYFTEQLHALSWLPQIWHSEVNLGVSTLSRMWFDYPFTLVVKLLSFMGFQWGVSEKILWAFALGIAIVSIVQLSNLLFHSVLPKILSVIIYCFNTYILMVFGGGQIGVALGYCFAPFALCRFLRQIDSLLEQKINLREVVRTSLFNGLCLAVLVAFDLRLAYLVIGAVVLYIVFHLVEQGRKIGSSMLPLLFFAGIIPGTVTVLLHLFWILPILMTGWRTIDQGEIYTGTNIVKDLSFADLPHTLSLLHANWPDNIFGKVYFFQPEFLVFPIIAFAAFFRKNIDKKIQYFALLALLGVFFAKGVNPPFGGIYYWLYMHVPGFVMFRDSSKFYMYIEFGYELLIPLGLQIIAAQVSRLVHRNIWIWISLLFFILWGFSIRQLFLGQLTGQFKLKSIPAEYVQFKDLLVHDPVSFRTLWMPSPEKFSYSSPVHPIITGSTLFFDSPTLTLTQLIHGQQFRSIISENGIKYIIVPIDVEKRIFMSDYKYDPSQRNALIQALTADGFVRLNVFKQLAVFVNPSYTFTQYTPPVIAGQYYWVRVGLIISVIVLISSVGTIIVLKRRT
jgi:hypothetical protein